MVNAYFHREELEDKVGRDADDNQKIKTNKEAAVTVRLLKVSYPMATALLQRAMCGYAHASHSSEAPGSGRVLL